MNTDKIDIKFSRLFPWHFLFLALVVFIIGVAIVAEKTILSICLMIASVFILTAYSGTEINTADKTYTEYNSFFLFIKSGKRMKYGGIEKLFINRSKVTQRMYSRTNQSSIFSHNEYNGYVKFDDGIKIQLLNKRRKKDLVAAIRKISAFIHVEVEDLALSEN